MATTFYLCLITALFLPVFDSMMTGGWTKRDPGDPKIQELANFAVNKYNKQSNYIYSYTLSNIISAKSQVVAGENVDITVDIGQTDCRKHYSENGNAQACNPNQPIGNKRLRCTFRVFEQQWRKIRELSRSSCH